MSEIKNTSEYNNCKKEIINSPYYSLIYPFLKTQLIPSIHNTNNNNINNNYNKNQVNLNKIEIT